MRGREGYITGWSYAISPSLFSSLFSCPLEAPRNVQKQRMQKKEKDSRGMKIEEEGGSVFSIHLTMEG